MDWLSSDHIVPQQRHQATIEEVVFSVRWSARLYNASALVASSVKRMGIQRHTAVQLSAGYNHRNLVAGEKFESQPAKT
jgi:hypothetical protein